MVEQGRSEELDHVTQIGGQVVAIGAFLGDEGHEWDGIATEVVFALNGYWVSINDERWRMPPIVPACPSEPSCHELLKRPLETLADTSQWPNHLCSDLERQSVRAWLNMLGTPEAQWDTAALIGAMRRSVGSHTEPLPPPDQPPRDWDEVWPLPVGDLALRVHELAPELRNLPFPSWTVYGPPTGFVLFAVRVKAGRDLMDLFVIGEPTAAGKVRPSESLVLNHGMPPDVAARAEEQLARLLWYMESGRKPAGRPRVFETPDELVGAVGDACKHLARAGKNITKEAVGELLFPDCIDPGRNLGHAQRQHGFRWNELRRAAEAPAADASRSRR